MNAKKPDKQLPNIHDKTNPKTPQYGTSRNEEPAIVKDCIMPVKLNTDIFFIPLQKSWVYL